jgi:transposase InsO family protein
MRYEIPMSLRRAIAQIDVTVVNVSEFCRMHGVSRGWFYEIRSRYAQEGEAGLAARSRAPHTVANRTPLIVEDLIVTLRKELVDDGLDAGPETIKWHLDAAGIDAPTTSTIWRILKRRGFVDPNPNKAPYKTWTRFAAERVNEMWQTDATHTDLADGTDVEVVNIVDDCSRTCVRSHAVDGPTTADDAWDAFVAAVAIYGIPACVLSDNGRAFTSTIFTNNLKQLGVATTNSRPYHPQTCGKVERFHQTLKKWLAAHPKPATITELQTLLDTFTGLYNTQRPHRGIQRRTPADVYTATPKAAPNPFSILDTTTVHHNTVDHNGRIEIPGPYSITVGAAHTGKTATTIRTGNHTHVFINNTLTRKLTINPNQRSQPLHPRPGRPT